MLAVLVLLVPVRVPHLDRTSGAALRESMLAIDRFNIVLAVVRILLVALWTTIILVLYRRLRRLVHERGLPPGVAHEPMTNPLAAYARWRERRRTRVYR